MIIPSIDIMGGQAVQLIGGKERALEAGDPRPLARKFGLTGDIAVVDLDAALGQGDNTGLIRELLTIAPCRVGGGIRSVDRAIEWLDAGATQIVLGTAATPEVLRELPRERVIAALDAVDNEVVVEGWQTKTGRDLFEQMTALREYVGGFLVTFVEREGRLEGTDLDRARRVREVAGDAALTIAGGVSTCEELAELDKLDIDAQVGMALYTNRMHLADALAAPLTSDRPDGLWPTVITDERGIALGLAYSNLESLRAAVNQQVGAYHSRSRGGLWIKGQTSGATQALLRIDLDCDRDALRFTVKQAGAGFCHKDTWTCWGPDRGLGRLTDVLRGRLESAPPGSYTRRLFEDTELLRKKLTEEAGELANARSQDEIRWETADILYFALVAMTAGNVDLAEVEAELDRRALKVSRRPGNAKTTSPPSQGGAEGG
jgi:phosphoribosyl-ATP pyrophosphohydrolase/phosphoribosyl-AMP cyclohydrolase